MIANSALRDGLDAAHMRDRQALRMNRLDRLSALLWLLASSRLRITLIVAIFVLPEVAAKDTYARILALAKPGKQRSCRRRGRIRNSCLSRTRDGAIGLPFDLADGGLRLHAMSKPTSSSAYRSALLETGLYSMTTCAQQAR